MSKRALSHEDEITGMVNHPVKDKPGAYKTVRKGLNGGGMIKQFGQVSPATRLAKDLFLNGNGDGKPVTNTAELALKSGCSIGTIERWRPVWEKERGQMLRANAGQGKLGGLVTGEVIAFHGVKVELLKNEVDRLADILPKLTTGSDTHRDTLKLFLAALKQWGEESGMTGHRDAQSTYTKEMLKIAARETGKPASDTERNVTPGFSFQTASTVKRNGIVQLHGDGV